MWQQQEEGSKKGENHRAIGNSQKEGHRGQRGFAEVTEGRKEYFGVRCYKET